MRPADNPFRSERIDALDYRLRGESWESALARLASLEHRAAVVGPRGHGKTTLLDALARRLAERGHEVVRTRIEGRAPFRADDARGRTFLLDGTETLGFWRRRQLRAQLTSARGLIVSLHAPGWLPTWIRCETDPALLAELCTELAPGAIDPDIVSELWQRHGGNLRSCLLELYARCADD